MTAVSRISWMIGSLTLAASVAHGQSMTAYSAITFTPNLGGGVVVSWVAVPKATTYHLTRSKEDDACCDWSVDVPGTTLSVIDGISAAGVYQYTVTAKYRLITGPSVQGTYILVALDPAPIKFRSPTVMTACTPMEESGGPPPGAVIGTPWSATSLSVGWDAVGGAVAYKLERAPLGGSTWTDLGCLPSSQTAYGDKTDTSLPATILPAGTYTYKVTAYQSNGASGWNSTRVTLGRMANPWGLTFTRTGNQVKLCWSFNGSAQAPEPNRFLITSSYGTNFSADGHLSRCATVYGVPDGTQVFQVGSGYYALPVMLETALAYRPSVTVVVSP